MNQLIDAANGVYVDPAEVSAVMTDVHGHVCILLRGISQPLLVRCESGATAEALAQALTSRINTVMAERLSGI